MNAEQTIAAAVGVLVFALVLRTIWRLVTSYEYPLDVKGDRWRELQYSLSERFDYRRLAALLVGVPLLSTALAYVLVVGLREVLL